MVDKQSKKKIIERFNRIEGQVRGLRQMIENERPCFEILKQISAIRGALRSLGQVMLQEHLNDCILSLDPNKDKANELKENLVKLFSKICSHE